MSAQVREKGSSISRVLEIIEAISRAERPMSPADLACHLNIPKPSIHRLIHQLEKDSYLQTNMRGLLLPGDRMESIALGVLYTGRHRALRQGILKKLAGETGETCGIAIPNGSEMIYYDRVQTDWPLQVRLPVGSHTPVWCTSSGKLYLSSLSDEHCRRMIKTLPLDKYTRNTLTDIEALIADIVKVRATGLSFDNEEFIDGMVACAVPIRGRNGKLFACLFTHAPIIRKSLEELISYTPHLQQAAEELGQLIDDTYDAKN